jgi:hypothetical protein
VTVRSVYSFHSHDMLVAGEVGAVVGGNALNLLGEPRLTSRGLRGETGEHESVHRHLVGFVGDAL